MTDDVPREVITTPFVDKNGREHPAWHVAEVKLLNSLWNLDVSRLFPQTVLEMRRVFERDPKAKDHLMGIITSPDGCYEVSPGVYGRVMVWRGTVTADFAVDWGSLAECAGARLREGLGNDPLRLTRAIEGIYDYMFDNEGACFSDGGTPKHGTRLPTEMFSSADFDAALAWLSRKSEELFMIDAGQRAALNARLDEAIASAGAGEAPSSP